MVSIEIKSRSKSLKSSTLNDVSLNDPISKIINDVSSFNKINSNRIRITYKDSSTKQIPLVSNNSLLDAGFTIKDNSITLYIKDLGPQLGWRTVYIIEYLGPLLIHPIFYYFFANYSNEIKFNQTQSIAFYLATLHFIKRELETIFIHKFSNATMPFFNIFKNSGHYWILSGFNLAYFIYKDDSNSSSSSSLNNFLFKVNDFPPYLNYALVFLWTFAELSNLKTHITLASLRSDANDKSYVIPKGYGFDWCSFPNYFFESLAWLSYAILVGNWSAWLFFIIGSGQMYIWAIKKHKRYLKIFGDDYKKLKRTAFIPFLA